jgi:hypothetical protein
MKKITSALLSVGLLVGVLAAPAGAEAPLKKHSDPVTYVRSLPYAWGVAEPAMEAFRVVATERGWAEDDIQAWVPFVEAVMRRESGHCPNVRRGANVATGAAYNSCKLSRQGRGSDSGFFQVISIHYTPGKWLCSQEGICSADAITSDPWASMVAGVALLERSGSQPWCFTKKLKRGHVCRLAP